MTSKELDIGMVEETHPSYDLYQLFFSAKDTGHKGASRDRTYVIGAHQDLTSCKFDPHTMKDIISKKMISKVQTRPSDYFFATVPEVLQEAEKLALKRNISFKPRQLDLTYLLTDREKASLQSYQTAYLEIFGEDPSTNQDLVVFLGDNGGSWKTWSARSNQIPTFRRNCRTGLFWSSYLKRFMISREKLATLGWPVVPGMAKAMNCAVTPSQDVLRASDLAGNAMNFTTVGVAQLIALSCFGPMF